MKAVYIFVIALLFSQAVYSQTEPGLGFGAGIGGSWGINESKTRPMNFMGRIIGRYTFSDQLSADLGVNYFKSSGDAFNTGTYETQMIPIDLRLNYSPFNFSGWKPYLLGGLGYSLFEIKTVPELAPPDYTKSGGAFTLIGGFGIEKVLSENLSLDLHLSGNHSLSDKLEPELDDQNDGNWNLVLGVIFRLPRGDADSDGDGLTNDEEKKLGTDSKNPDSDGDGLTDGQEVNKYKTDPLNSDTDGDGLKDGAEVKDYETDPLKKDTDGDGLSDGQEILSTKTDPLKPDTDGDGLKDGEEVNTYKTNPLDKDTDLDKLTDGDEVLKYKTNPLKSDTDGDGLLDNDEVLTHSTDPNKPDTDGDGLTDGDEVKKYGTNPLKADTDNGTVSDGVEVKRGTNPLDKSDDINKTQELFQSEVGKAIVLEGIVFETGKSDILPESEVILNQALKTFKDNPGVEVEISGHTDNVGNKKKNQKLSLDRANSVKKWLTDRGIDGKRITTKGYGPDKPIAPNDTPENKQKNRRIEFLRTK